MLKTILVPLYGVDSDNAGLEYAYRLTKLFGSHIDCLYVRPDLREVLAQTSGLDFGAPLISTELLTAIEAEDKARALRVQRAFDEFCMLKNVPVCDSPPGQDGMSAAWHEIMGDVVGEIVHHARIREIVVLARPSEQFFSLSEIGDVLMRSGRPLLLVPPTGSATIATTIAIAWKETAEAARALTAAMPLLAKAERVVIISVDEGGSSVETTTGSAERLAQALRWDGIHAGLRRLVAEARDVPEQILDAASYEGADLMVMGGYSHSRARELVFGGFTRHVLGEAKLPVLLCH